MPPVNLLIKPASSLCNMRCKYCFYADVSEHRENKSYGIMTKETIEHIVKNAFEYADGFAGFAFQGGEPTLAGLDFFKELLELQKKYNVKNLPVYNSIQTNGYATTEEWAKFFADNKFLVGISIDGTREAHDTLRVDAKGQGTYDRIIKTTELFDKYKVEYNILCVVNNFVARHPKNVYNNLRRFKYIQFIPCLDSFEGEKFKFSLTEDRYREFLKVTFDLYYKDFMSGNYVSVRNFDNYLSILMGRCPENCAMNGFCTCYFVIEGDGSVYPCDFYVLDEWKLGNINTDSFKDMIESQTAKKFVAVSKYVSEECKKCRYYQICRGGCRREREPIINGKPSLNRHCESFKSFFDYSIERMVEMANVIRRNNQR